MASFQFLRLLDMVCVVKYRLDSMNSPVQVEVPKIASYFSQCLIALYVLYKPLILIFKHITFFLFPVQVTSKGYNLLMQNV